MLGPIIMALSMGVAALSPSTALVRQADSLERQRQFAAAEGVLHRAIHEAGDGEFRAAAALRICRLAQRAEDGARARRCYLELAPRLPKADDRATAFYHALTLAPYDEAALRRVLQAYPGTPAARRLCILGRAMARQRGGPSAEEAFLQRLAELWPLPVAVAAATPADADPRGLLVRLALSRSGLALAAGDAAGAAARLQEQAALAEQVGPRDQWLFCRARVLRLQGDLAAAATSYGQLTDADDAHPGAAVDRHFSRLYDQAHLERGEVLAQLGDMVGARRAYAQLLQRSPTSRLRRRVVQRLQAEMPSQ